MAAGGHDLVRKSRSHSSARQRRCASSVEYMREAHHARSSSRAGSRGASRAALPGIAPMAMTETAYRIERDSMGEVRVPADALYGAQTQRAVENFPVSG